MNEYTIYCTEEQTKKALELGAPINIEPYDNEHLVPQKCPKIIIKYPTAEQMIGWLEEKGISISIDYEATNLYSVSLEGLFGCIPLGGGTRKDATLAAIDEALEYLTNSKNK